MNSEAKIGEARFTKTVSLDLIKNLEKAIYLTLETYSNVHRGSGYSSQISTQLFEEARGIILDYLNLSKKRYQIIFCTPERASKLKHVLEPESYKSISSAQLGLSIGVVALAVKKSVLPKGIPFHSGGGTTKLIGQDWIIWAESPDKYEAGTPAVVNIVTLAKALQLLTEFSETKFYSSKNILSVNDILYQDDLVDFTGSGLFEELNKTLLGLNFMVPTINGMQKNINLDNSASTPTFKPIWETFNETLFQPEDLQEELIGEVKSICSEFINAPLSKYNILFTSNTTESVNILAEKLDFKLEPDLEPVILSTLLEHSSNDLPWRQVPGATVIRLEVDRNGFIDLNEIKRLLEEYNHNNKHENKRITLLAISGASNVLGACNNIAAISKVAKQFGIPLMVDAAQLIAHRKIDVEANGIDFLAFSAHKIYAPFGCGVLVVNKKILNIEDPDFSSLRESGEENVCGIAALGKSINLMNRIGMDVVIKEEREITSYALESMSTIPNIKIYGITDPDSKEFENKVGVIPFSIKGMLPKRVANELAIYGGIGVRHGCHCAHIIVKRIIGIPPKLEQFQRLIQILVPGIRLPGVVRISFGIENSKKDIDTLIDSLKLISIQQKHPLYKSVRKEMRDFIRRRCDEIYG